MRGTERGGHANAQAAQKNNKNETKTETSFAKRIREFFSMYENAQNTLNK